VLAVTFSRDRPGRLLRACLCATSVAIALIAQPALGADTDDRACFDAAAAGQKLERQTKLIEARAAYVACAQKRCPVEVVAHCTEWLVSVSEAIPSVLLVGRDSRGRDVVDAQTMIDGVVIPDAFSGNAISLDPGLHRLRFSRQSSTPVDLTLVARIHEKERRVNVEFTSESVPVPLAAWLLGGVGLVGGGVFVGFGSYGLSQRGAYGCGVACSPDEYASVRRDFVTADVGLGVGILALGGAAWLFFSRPRHAASTASASVNVWPLVDERGAGLVGRF
jgi:hypothetical protein